MDYDSPADFISDLPQGIIESILTCLPIRDAVRTSILSTKWRYKWATLTQLVFDEKSVDNCVERTHVGNDIVIKFISRLLLLHNGPIHKFQLSNIHLHSCPDIDQWILFLSRNDLKELILELGEGEWLRVPSCLFTCKKLTRLELFRCELDPPLNFKGFMCLKSLNLNQVLIAPEAIESLISCCPLLENLALSYFDSLALNIRAPNLKYLCLEGEFKDICLENSPLLVAISIAMYMTDDIAEYFEQSPRCCNFEKFLGQLPRLERLIRHIDFTKDPSVTTFDQIKLPDNGLLCDLLWSDPDPRVVGLEESDRGVSCTFGVDRVADFLDKNESIGYFWNWFWIKMKAQVMEVQRELEVRKEMLMQYYNMNIATIDQIAGGARSQADEKRRNDELSVKKRPKGLEQRQDSCFMSLFLKCATR